MLYNEALYAAKERHRVLMVHAVTRVVLQVDQPQIASVMGSSLSERCHRGRVCGSLHGSGKSVRLANMVSAIVHGPSVN